MICYRDVAGTHLTIDHLLARDRKIDMNGPWNSAGVAAGEA